MKKKNYKARLVILYILSFIVTIAPVLIFMAFNYGEYVSSPSDAVRLSLGAVLVGFFVFLKVIGKLHMPRRVVFFGILFVLSYLLQPVLMDFYIISGLALLGEAIDEFVFMRLIKKTKELILVDKTASTTTDMVEEVIQKHLGGRV